MSGDALRSIIEKRGTNFRPWIDNLPQIIEDCKKGWSIKVNDPFPDLSYNYVAPVVLQDGSQAVLKLSPPEDHEFLTELEALKVFDGRGIIRLLESDIDSGAMLLERVSPGISLEKLEVDEDMTDIAISVMNRLWCTAPAVHNFPTMLEWSKGFVRMRAEFYGGTGPFPTDMVEQAEKIYSEYCANPNGNYMLHGDFHHGNILSSHRDSWLAIDPKGLVGEREYDTAAFLRSLNKDEILISKRLDQISEKLQMSKKRLSAWAFAQSVLSAWWSYEDMECDSKNGWQTGINGAALFERVYLSNC